MDRGFNAALNKSRYRKFFVKLEMVETNWKSAGGSEINPEEDDWITYKNWLLVERQIPMKFLTHQPWDYSYVVFSMVNRHKYGRMKFVYETKLSIFRFSKKLHFLLIHSTSVISDWFIQGLKQ